MAQMDLRAIVDKNDDILARLSEMERATAVLEQKAGGYASSLQDKIMQEIKDLLMEIKKIIRETKTKTQVFSEAKKEGAIFINNTENAIASKINKI